MRKKEAPMWYLKQIFPLTYRTTYEEGGEKHFCVWKMWLGRCYRINDVVIGKAKREAA